MYHNLLLVFPFPLPSCLRIRLVLFPQNVCFMDRSKKKHLIRYHAFQVYINKSPMLENVEIAFLEEELPPSQTSPHFTQPLDEELYPLERDENVRIQCVVAGEPCPKIVWSVRL